MDLDENKIKDINDQLSMASKQLEKLNASSTLAGKNSSILSQTIASMNQDEKQMEEQLDKFKDGLKKSASGLLKYAKTLENNGSSFKPLNSAINVATKVLGALASTLPIVGDKLKKIAEGAGEVAKFMVDSFEKSYGMFEKLSGTGVVRTFDEFREAGDKLSLTYESTNRVLSTVGKDLALFGGSATKGREVFLQVGMESIELRDKFQKLGIGAADFAEFQASYMAQQALISGGEKKTAKDIKEGTERYINELDIMSKVTGIDRKKIQDSMRARYDDPKYIASIQDMKGEVKTNVDNLITMTSKFGPDIEAAVKEMIAAQVNGTVANGPEANALRVNMNNVGVDIEKVIGELVRGNASWIDVTQAITNNAKPAIKQIQDTTRVYGDSLVYTKLTRDLNNAAVFEGKINVQLLQEIIDQNKKTTDATTGQNAELAKTRTALTKAQKNIEQLATESETATIAMGLLAESIEEITIKFYEMSKTELPEHLKAKKKEIDATKKLRALEEQRAKLMQTSPEDAAYMYGESPVQDQLDKLEQQIINQQAVVNAAIRNREQAQQRAGLGSPSGASGTPQLPPDPIVTGGGGTGSDQGDMTTNYSGLNIRANPTVRGVPEPVSGGPAHKKAVELARKIQSSIPGVTFTAFNDSYNRGPTSAHSSGKGVDFTLPYRPGVQQGEEIVSKLKGLGASFALDEYNNPSRGATGPHMHAQVARTGGIFSGPSTGYLAELHGDEIVVPANEGSSKQQFMSDMSSGGLTGTTKILYDDMSSKMDELVRLLDDTVQSQNKFLQQAMS